MAEIEIFRLTPVVGETCYEYAESTRRQGRYPRERYFTNTQPLYVGHFVRSERGGFGDGGWQRDYFKDNTGKEHVVNYSYEGTTCFREVPCRPAAITRLETLTRKVVKDNIDYSALPEGDRQRTVIEETFGGKSRRSKKSKQYKKRTWSRRYKKSINCRRPKGFSQKQYCKYGRKTSKNN